MEKLQSEKRRLEGLCLARRDSRRRILEGISGGRAKMAWPIPTESGTHAPEEGYERE